MAQLVPLYIEGEFRQSESNQWIDVTNLRPMTLSLNSLVLLKLRLIAQ